MMQQLVWAITTLYFSLAAFAAPSLSAELYAQLFPLTGEVRLLNRDSVSVPFVFYSITSEGGALDGTNGVWTSISDTYDASGSGFVDPVADWSKLSSLPTELTEGVFSGPGGSLASMRAISLGAIWNPAAVPFPDLSFDIREPDEEPVDVIVELALAGDYSEDQTVDQADYVLWRKYLDSMDVLLADGNLNGLVDAADYLVWRENFGVTLPLPPYGSGIGTTLEQQSASAAGVPEPATVAVLFGALAAGSLHLGRRTRPALHRHHRSLRNCNRSSTSC